MKAEYMNKIQGCSIKRNTAAAMLLGLIAIFAVNVAQANGSYGTNTDLAGNAINVPTYYANSPQGIQPAFDLATHAPSANGVTVDTGTPLRKFVDPLAGAYNGLDGGGIPVAIAEKWFNPLTKTQTQDDYYEIGIVEYTEQMHSDLPKPTRLRGYVQIETPSMGYGLTGKKDVAGVASEHIQAFYPDGKTPILDAAGKQVYFVHQPHYLGPVIVAHKGTPVRIKASNYLPYTDIHGLPVGTWNGLGAELPIPVDETIPGGGPILDVNGQPVLDKNGHPIKMAQNRVGIHWHGGDTPWISDGTPHQWFAPARDISYTLGVDASHPSGLGKGDSAANVPDMADPGPGSYTLYFPNNLSGRLMFYHDHTSGLTRLNVYEGVAAGYVVVDDTELALVANALGTALGNVDAASGLPVGLLDSVGIPLVIQDKTFVPKNIGAAAVASDGTPQSQDAKWDLNHWGQPGDLFFPHVYETNQDPNSIDGTNPVGRWDWGPWFWPVFPAQMSLPTGEYGHVTTTPEAFMDTAVVNGQAYPTLTLDPKTYRFRILSVGNDRAQNLSLYQAVDAMGVVCDTTNTAPAANTVAPGGIGAPATCTEVKMVPAMPTAGFPATWPTDGRPGGVPDPATAGPDIVQIGNEGGLLPAPAIWKSQPVTYDQNVRNITVFNVLNHALLLGPAERADVLIDFSKYAGQTLILYNDAPAPMPGYDPRIDYFTGVGDQTGAGGAFDTPAGYGPNTRTVMQIKVNAAVNPNNPGSALDVTALANALPAAYAATQPAPVIPEVVYNAPFGTTQNNNYATIGTGANSVGAPGSANAIAGYFSYVDNGASKSIKVINKAIQELFDPIYGRMNATLAVELPFSSATVATTIPLSYVDTPVESLDAIKDGETQIWKITHNGVDSHPVHFHLVNIQLINRVGWDGRIKPPEANEVGWKETLRMNPLEDVYVAVRAVHPVTPFGLPKSARLLDPSQAAGSTLGFTQIDPVTGQAPTFQTQLVNGVTMNVGTTLYANALTDFDNEYVWHCHILGHEEADFMRPFIFHPNVVVPDAPAAVSVSGNQISWTDTTPVGGQDAQGIPTAGTNAANPTPTSSPKNEIGFKVVQNAVVTTSIPALSQTIITTVRTTNAAGVTTTTSSTTHNTVPATVVTSTQTNTIALVPANSTSWSGAMPTSAANPTVQVRNTTTTTTSTVRVGRVTTRTTVATTTAAHTNATSTAYNYAVVAYNAAGDSAQGTSTTTTTASATVAPAAAPTPIVSLVPAPAVAAAAGPTGLTQTVNADGSVTLSWVAVPGATGYLVNVNGSTVACAPISATSCTVAATATGFNAGGNNSFSVAAQTLSGTTAGATTSAFTGAAYSPVNLVATGSGSTITVVWGNDVKNVKNVSGFTLTLTPLNGSPISMTLAASATGASIVGLASGSYTVQLVANSGAGNSTPVSVPASL